MEPASDSNLSVPIKGIDRKHQLFLFPIQGEEKKIEEAKESIPSVWRNVSEKEWNDWRWQLRHRITKLEQLQEILALTPEEIEGIADHILWFSLKGLKNYMEPAKMKRSKKSSLGGE